MIGARLSTRKPHDEPVVEVGEPNPRHDRRMSGEVRRSKLDDKADREAYLGSGRDDHGPASLTSLLCAGAADGSSRSCERGAWLDSSGAGMTPLDPGAHRLLRFLHFVARFDPGLRSDQFGHRLEWVPFDGSHQRAKGRVWLISLGKFSR